MDGVSLALGGAIIAAFVTGVFVSKIDDIATLRLGARMLMVGAVIIAGMALASCREALFIGECIILDTTTRHC